MNIFVYANMESKIKRCKEKKVEEENYSDKELEKKIKEIDKQRMKYTELISDLEWGKKENYDLCINTSYINIKDIIKPLTDYINTYFKEVK